jgi:hypothetical protein
VRFVKKLEHEVRRSEKFQKEGEKLRRHNLVDSEKIIAECHRTSQTVEEADFSFSQSAVVSPTDFTIPGKDRAHRSRGVKGKFTFFTQTNYSQ